MATAAAVDVAYLSGYLSIPETTLASLLDEPTKDLVNSVLHAVQEKAKEHDELQADKTRLEVELEQTVRTAENRRRALQTNLDKALKDAAELREKLKEEENIRSTLESELQNAKSTSLTSSSEVHALRSRISALESSNRDTLSLLESKSTAYDRLTDELSAAQQKNIELRRDLSNKEHEIQTAQSAETRARFKEENLKNEIERLTNSTDFLDSELKTKTAEYLKYRKEKGARIAELERLKDDADALLESHKRTEESLRSRLEELTNKYNDTIAKIQQYEDQAVTAEQSFQTELAAATRLADLWEESAKSAKERLKELEATVEELRDAESEMVGRMRAEAETERTEKEAAERRISELEEQVERLESEIAANHHVPSMPGTPRGGINGSSTPQGLRNGSPIFSPGSATRGKGSLNLTQLYAEYTKAKAELNAERRRNERLTGTIDDMVQDLESKGPEIQEMKSENERLNSEILEMSAMLDESHKDRDRAKKEARKWEAEVRGLRTEAVLLRKQLRDLSVQIRVLVSEIYARDQGLDELNAAQRSQLESIARGDAEDDEQMTDTDRFISENLVVFKNIAELQEKNQALDGITRQLQARMEEQEALSKKTAEQVQETEQLRIRVERYKDEVKTLTATSQSYIKERDMFRRMLQHRGQLPVDGDFAAMFGQSMQPATPSRGGVIATVEQSPNAKEVADYAALLKELQAHFDSYREEAATDRRTLKDQVDGLTREKADLQAQLRRAEGDFFLATERYEMLQSNYNSLKNENIELQKRSQLLSENAAKQDIRTQQVAEDLVEARSMIESMRSENANLKAEKALSRNIEQRMSQDNESLVNERTRLNNMVTNLQTLQNQRELAEGEMRSRLQSQVQTLEAELATTKRRLDAEVDEARKAALRREYDSQQTQKRIDDLVAALGSVREELVAAKTMKDHLQARVDELTIEFKSAEEKVQALQPRPTPRSNANHGPDGTQNGEDEEDSLSREQELAFEVLELKRELELTKTELENAKNDADQYQEISQSAEEALQNLNETHDQYREEMDSIMQERAAKIRDLETRIDDLAAELSTATAELSAVRTEAATKVTRSEEEKVSLEREITRLKDEVDRYGDTAKFYQEDLKTQAAIAQEAQANYETELVKHAEAAKALQKIRTEYNDLKSQVAGFKSEAEAAKITLSQNEDNWDEMRQDYEKEIREIKARRDDLSSQNKILYQQLEDLSKQVSALRETRAKLSEAEGSPSGTPSTADRSVDELYRLINYERKEKDIVNAQYEVLSGELQRANKNLSRALQELDEARLKLDQERRSHADGGRNAAEYEQLKQKLEMSNLHQEATITLRNENRQLREQVQAKSTRVEELLAQVQPLEAKFRELENEIETKNGEMQLLQEDRDRWQQRNHQLLQKYDRIDPAEMDTLKEQISSLQKQVEETSAEKETWSAQLAKAVEEAVVPWRQQREKLVDQTKERLRALRQQLTEKTAELEATLKEKEELAQQLTSLKEELAAVKSERDAATAMANAAAAHSNQQPDASDSAMRDGLEEGQVSDDQRTELPAEEKKELEQRLVEAEARANQEISAYKDKIAELERQIVDLRKNLETAQTQLNQPRSPPQQPQASANDSVSSETIEQLRQDLSAAQQEVETLKASAAIYQAAVDASTGGESQDIAKIKAEMDQKLQSRSNQLRTKFNEKLQEGRERNAQELEKLKADHQQELNKLNSEHREEIERLNDSLIGQIEQARKEEASKLEQQRNEIFAAQSRAISAGSIPVETVKMEGQESQGQRQEPQVQTQEVKTGPRWVTVPVTDWTPDIVKEFISSNATAKEILRRNISEKLNKEKEALLVKFREERTEEVKAYEAKLDAAQKTIEMLQQKVEAAQKNIEVEKQNATALEGQKAKAKISMAENRAKQALAKLEVVEKAARETPQKPVSEVWAVAKDAKPAPAAAPQSALPQPATQAPVPTNPQASFAQQSFGQPSAAVQQNNVGPPTPVTVLGNPVHPMNSAAAATSTQQIPRQPPHQQENHSSLPVKPPVVQQNAGTGPSALRGIVGQQSGIPRGGAVAGRVQGQMRRGSGQHIQNQLQIPQDLQQSQQGFPPQYSNQGQNQRGGHPQSNLPRGGANRGGRGGRGGAQQNAGNTSVGQPNSPGAGPGKERGGLNAGARQFVPGAKRSRDDGTDSSEGGNIGKRVRGSAGGA